MNNKMGDILKLARIQILLIVLFIFFKLIRYPVLNSPSPAFFKKVLYALPNFFEAITGILVLTGIGLLLNDRLKKKNQLGLKNLYLLVVIIAGGFVITQELNVYNLRGDNTFDQNDLIFSVIGLIIGYWIILSKKPRILKE